MMIRLLLNTVLLATVTLSLSAAQLKEPKPNLFLTQAQADRAKKQVSEDVRLERSATKLKNDLAKNLRDWSRIMPPRAEKYTMQEIFEAAKGAKTRPDLQTESAAMILFPSEECARVLREKMLYEIGIHKNEGSWRELGIHQGERLARFLQAYDIVAQTGLFNDDEKQAIKAEVHQAARFLQAWCLEGPMNHIFQGQTFCFNIKYYPICMLGVVGLYFPEFEESKEWVANADDMVLRLLLTENFIDGGYGENSIHYWAPTNHGLQLYVLANKNLGHRDYTKDLTFRNYYSKFVRWRADLTATDGRKVAIGDGHRCAVGSEEMIEAAYLLDDHELAWIARSIHQRVNGGYMLTPHALLAFDSSFEPKEPTYKAANYIWSGYGIYRSGWGADDNFLMMKYGPTWAGRREVEKLPVVAGHSHQDCMGIEMLYRGTPMLVDGGYRGVYRDYDTYGGFWKATIAHNTVGLGNDYGYSRTDGRFDEHVAKHGKEFRYEKEQINTYRNSSRLTAYSDTQGMVLLSAKATTYKDVEHERTIVWFRDNSLTILYDRLESDKPQNYELYLNPVGKLLAKADNYTFGDDKAKLDVCIVGEQKGAIEVVGKGTQGVPKYYYPFRPSFRSEPQWDGPNARWADYMLMVQAKKADTTSFLNVLIPYQGETPYSVTALGARAKKLVAGSQEIFVAERMSDKNLDVDARFGVIRTVKGTPSEYVVKDGYRLALGKKELLTSKLRSQAWAPLYDHKVTGAVSVESKTATFVLNPNPWGEYMLMYNPKIAEGVETPEPIRVEVSFYAGSRPNKMIWQRSQDSMPQMESKVYDEKSKQANFGTGLKNHQLVEGRMTRKAQQFDYNAKTGMVTVVLPEGFNHLVWE